VAATGWRPIVSGTGIERGIVEDSFVMERRGELQHAVNRFGRAMARSSCRCSPNPTTT
jgi:hypothetical protein